MTKKFLLAVLALFITLGLSAQRTAKGQFFIDASATVSVPEFGVGAHAYMGQYRTGFFWDAGFMMLSDKVYFSNGKSAGYMDLMVGGGAFWRPLATRTRSLNVYLGGDGFVGLELYDPFNILEDKDKTLADGTVFTGNRFIYGVIPAVEAEYFFWDRLALVAAFRLPVVINSRVTVLRYSAEAGLRYNF